METQCQSVKVSDGHFIPILGFGTYAPKEREALEFTKFTLEVGFRHTDCTHAYKNEEHVGQAIRSKIADGTVKREDIFYTSKGTEIKLHMLKKNNCKSNYNWKHQPQVMIKKKKNSTLSQAVTEDPACPNEDQVQPNKY
ncbi:prostaglandin F synthase 1-like [Cervus elaphus]|uniref:prostaglandin F synthase 1-like n=1 Tax=Cervus elaphus TaxID=9860 RepID=UPI001CC2D3CC|nr:prostaglandin F synthase 1-like [Cervus elaphus]